ncbi:DUF2255 family protein [Mycobacterium sp. ZZG]
MPDWNEHELDALDRASEIDLATYRTDGTLRRAVPVWVVRVGHAVYLRSYRGTAGSWYRHALANPHGHITTGHIDRDVHFTDAAAIDRSDVDTAYRNKYGNNSYVDTLLSDDIATTTLHLTPT